MHVALERVLLQILSEQLAEHCHPNQGGTHHTPRRTYIAKLRAPFLCSVFSGITPGFSTLVLPPPILMAPAIMPMIVPLVFADIDTDVVHPEKPRKNEGAHPTANDMCFQRKGHGCFPIPNC